MIETKIFIRKPLFTQYVQSLKPEFDANKTNGMYDWSFMDTDCEVVTTRCAKEYFEALNKRFGYFIDADKSTTRRSRWIVTFDDGVSESVEVAEEAVVETPAKASKVINVYSAEAPSDEDIEVLSSDENLSFDLIDWPRVEAYKNTKGDKAELDKYASQFGVSLKRNMKVENMVDAFKMAAGVEL
jgi:hypothetical protein